MAVLIASVSCTAHQASPAPGKTSGVATRPDIQRDDTSRATTTPRPDRPWQIDWARGAVFYQVFVRSFHDSDGDGVGDLPGLISRLDYLNDGDPKTDDDLGIDGIWLMPVFASPSYHGYDVVDYEEIDREYGSNDDFRRLCEEAHRRGIRVITDFVMNHTGRDHLWFQLAAERTDSEFHDWYVWRDDDPGWFQPWGNGPTWHGNPRGAGGYYYGIFWGGMPDLDFRNPRVRDEMKRLAVLWLQRGADGLRLDATRHLFASGPGDGQNDQPESHAYLKEFSAHIRSVRPDAFLVGENWTSTERIAPYFGSIDPVRGSDELPSSFNFPLAGAIVDGINRGAAQPVHDVLAAMKQHYPDGAIDATFLRNHDQIRLATALRGHPPSLGLAAAILLTLPGTPFLYYGEEIGLQNGGNGPEDELKRTPMPWTAEPGGGFTTATPWHPFAPGQATDNVAAQRRDPDSLLARYRHLIRMRKRSEALRIGDITPLALPAPGALGFLRSTPSQTVLVIHNLESARLTLDSLPIPRGFRPHDRLTRMTVTLERAPDGAWRVELPPRASAVFELIRPGS